MRRIIANQPAGKLILIFFAITLSTSGLFTSADAVSIVRTRDLDPNPVLSPKVGNESKIFYSIPDNAKEVLTPGTLVSVIPSGCSTKYTSKLTYYDCDGLYFKQYYKGNKLVYMVIDRP